MLTEHEKGRAVGEQAEGVQQRFQAILDAVPLGIMHLDFQGRIVAINRWFREHVLEPRQESDEFIGRELTETSLAVILNCNQAVNGLIQGQSFSDRAVRLTGQYGIERSRLSLAGVPLYGLEGTLDGGMLILEDRTNQQELEGKSGQYSLLETAGTLAGWLTPDFNSMLRSIWGRISALKSRMDPGDSLFSDMEAIESAWHRASELSQTLRSFNRRRSSALVSLDLNQACREAAAIVRPVFEHGVTFSLELNPTIPPVAANEDQIQRALIHLFMNAHDAMPHGGILRVRTGFINDRESKALGLEDAPRGGVWLSIQDEGVGMVPSVREKIFQPFFSTKREDGHAGLGLAMVQDIVQHHKGAIRVESQVGRGSVFTLYFAALSSPLEADDQQKRSNAKKKGLVLLVDDEPIIRSLGVKLLEAGGYRVITASDGGEAIQRFQERQDDVDLIILDVMMPDMEGQEVLKELVKINPEIKVLLSSGYTSESGVRSALSSGAKGFIQKPYRMGALLQKMREVLDGRTADDSRRRRGRVKIHPG